MKVELQRRILSNVAIALHAYKTIVTSVVNGRPSTFLVTAQTTSLLKQHIHAGIEVTFTSAFHDWQTCNNDVHCTCISRLPYSVLPSQN